MKTNFNKLLLPIITSASLTTTACQTPFENKPKPQEALPAVQPKEITIRSTTDEIRSEINKIKEEARIKVGSINPDITSITQGRQIEAEAEDMMKVVENYRTKLSLRTRIVEGCRQTRLFINGKLVQKDLTPATDPLVKSCVEARISATELKDQNKAVKFKATLDAATANENAQTAKSVK